MSGIGEADLNTISNLDDLVDKGIRKISSIHKVYRNPHMKEKLYSNRSEFAPSVFHTIVEDNTFRVERRMLNRTRNEGIVPSLREMAAYTIGDSVSRAHRGTIPIKWQMSGAITTYIDRETSRPEGSFFVMRLDVCHPIDYTVSEIGFPPVQQAIMDASLVGTLGLKLAMDKVLVKMATELKLHKKSFTDNEPVTHAPSEQCWSETIADFIIKRMEKGDNKLLRLDFKMFNRNPWLLAPRYLASLEVMIGGEYEARKTLLRKGINCRSSERFPQDGENVTYVNHESDFYGGRQFHSKLRSGLPEHIKNERPSTPQEAREFDKAVSWGESTMMAVYRYLINETDKDL